MRGLQITLFILGNVLFLGQLGRDVHHLIWGVETSILDQFNPAQTSARAEQNFDSLVQEYHKSDVEMSALEKGLSDAEVEKIRRDHKELYEMHSETYAEIRERERKSRELRDLWAYSGYGLCLILAGMQAHRRQPWAGMALAISGFSILEYWASPPFFSGAYNEFRALLWSKTVLTALAVALLYFIAHVMERRRKDGEARGG